MSIRTLRLLALRLPLGLIDLVGAAPKLQIAVLDKLGFLASGKTALNVYTGIVGGSAIVGGPALVHAARGECGCQ